MSRESLNLFRGQLIEGKKKLSLKAFSIAEEAHKGVMRKDGVTPYIEHPAKVASMLLELGIDEDEILATAILHDVIEDTEIDAIGILEKYNDGNYKRGYDEYFLNKIIEAVRLVSKGKNYNDTDYYAAISSSPIACLVKIADRAHNLSTLYAFFEEKKAKYLKETKEFVFPLIKFAQHNYYEYSKAFRILDLWIESIVKNLEPYMKGN